MSHARLKETDQGIQGEFAVAIYDRMQRRFRDKGWIDTKAVIKSGITDGAILKIKARSNPICTFSSDRHSGY